MMWADFFPWCAGASVGAPVALGPAPVSVLIPRSCCCVGLGVGPLHGVQFGDTQTGAPTTTIVPGIGLMIGYYYHRLFSSAEDSAAMAPPAPPVAGCVGRDVRRRMFFWRSTASPPVAGVHCRGVPMFIVTIVSLAGLLPCRASITRTPGTRHGRGPGDRLRGAGGELRVSRDRSGRVAPEGCGGNQNPALGTQPALFMYIPGWPKNEDALYYLEADNVVPDLTESGCGA